MPERRKPSRPHPKPKRRAKPRPDMPIWQCPNCGQSYFGPLPPDLCDYCQDFTTWRPVHKPADET